MTETPEVPRTLHWSLTEARSAYGDTGGKGALLLEVAGDTDYCRQVDKAESATCRGHRRPSDAVKQTR